MQNQITIRAMEFDDLDAVYDIETKAHIAPWTRGIIHDCILVGYGCYVLLKENNVVAFSIVRTAVGECHILNLCVKPEEQNRGHGQQLLEHVLNTAKTSCKNVVLEVRKSNTAAIKLYQRMGFSQIGYRRDYYPGPTGREDAIIYGLEFK